MSCWRCHDLGGRAAGGCPECGSTRPRAMSGVREDHAGPVDLVPTALPSERWWARQAGEALGEWLRPLNPVAIVTMNGLDPLGAGSWRHVCRLGHERWAWLSGGDPGRIGGLGFTQPNDRGVGQHLHAVIFGEERTRNVNRISWAQYIESECERLHRLELGYDQGVNEVRVECKSPWGLDRSGVTHYMAYCYRYVNRVVDGGHFEFGAGLGALFAIAMGTDTEQLGLAR